MRLKCFKQQLFMVLLGLSVLAVTLPSCGVKDSSIEKAITDMSSSTPVLAGIQTSVKNGVVTLSGEYKDEASKMAAEQAIKSIKGVKSVVDNGTIALPMPMPAPTTVEAATDDLLRKGVEDAIKSYPGVKADVKDGVITLTGEIKKSSLQTLMMALSSLQPKKIENNLTVK